MLELLVLLRCTTFLAIKPEGGRKGTKGRDLTLLSRAAAEKVGFWAILGTEARRIVRYRSHDAVDERTTSGCEWRAIGSPFCLLRPF